MNKRIFRTLFNVARKQYRYRAGHKTQYNRIVVTRSYLAPICGRRPEHFDCYAVDLESLARRDRVQRCSPLGGCSSESIELRFIRHCVSDDRLSDFEIAYDVSEPADVIRVRVRRKQVIDSRASKRPDETRDDRFADR